MKKSLKTILVITVSTLVFTSTGCLFLYNYITKNSPATASSDEYILVDSETMTIGADKKNKTAYLVKVNYGSSIAAAKYTGSYKSSSKAANTIMENTEEETEIPDNLLSESERSHSAYCGFKSEYQPLIKADENSSRTTVAYTDPDYEIGDTKSFFVAINENNKNSYTSTKATLKAIGKYNFVWYIPSSKSFIDETKIPFDELSSKFDTIYSKETSIFGTTQMFKTYTNTIKTTTKQKINILVYDLYSDATQDNKQNGTYGFFRPTDFYLNGENGSGDISNECQLINLDSWLFQCSPESMYSTAVHEFQHLLNFVNKFLNRDNDESSIWFNEMMSMISEEVFQHILNISDEDSPKSRLYFYNSCYNYGFSDATWNYTESKNLSGTFDYSNSYAFGTYLMHNYGGVELVHQLATNSYIDEEAVTMALQSLGYQDDFTSVLCRFAQTIANADGNSSTFNTLNKSLSPDSKYNISIDAISLSDYNPTTLDSINKLITNGLVSNPDDTYNINPYIYSRYENKLLYPYGMSVHYLGKIGSSGETYTFNLPAEKNAQYQDLNIAMYIMLK